MKADTFETQPNEISDIQVSRGGGREQNKNFL